MTKRLSPELIARALGGASTEWYLTDPNAFGLTTASPLQRAISRVVDGAPLVHFSDDPAVCRAFGDVRALPTSPPKEVAIFSGIRSGKSLFAACCAVRMALSCDVTGLRLGETPRVSVLSLTKDLADVIMGHVVGGIERSPLLRQMRIGQPQGDAVMLRHPSGMPVEIKVVAGSRAGSSLVARWSAGAIFDEFPRMVGGDEGVVNWTDSREAISHRLLPGAQLFHVGSPWAPVGPAYELCTKHWGAPTANLVVVKATAPDMNPVLWTPEKVAEAVAFNPDAAKTDVFAEFRTPEEAMFSSESIRKCTRAATELVLPRRDGQQYVAAMDPATRGNGWSLVVATRERGRIVVVYANEWIGSRDEPLDPADTLSEIATVLVGYGLTTVHSDQAFGDALIKLGWQAGVTIVQWRFVERERAEKYMAIKTRLDRGEIELPPVPALRNDLLHIRKRVTPTGYGVVLPLTSDGRHCDYGPSLMLALSKFIAEPEPMTVTTVDDETLRLRKLVAERFGGSKKGLFGS